MAEIHHFQQGHLQTSWIFFHVNFRGVCNKTNVDGSFRNPENSLTHQLRGTLVDPSHHLR